MPNFNYNFRKMNLANKAESDLIKESTKDQYLGDIALSKNLNDCIVFLDGNKPIGFAIPRKESDGTYRTGPIYVTPEYRKRGVAKTWALEYFNTRQGRAWIEENNVASKALFKAIGFIPTGKSMLVDNETLLQYTKMKPAFSNEAYSFNLKTKLAAVLQPHIEKMCEYYRMFKTLDDKHVQELTKLMTDQTGIRFTTTIHTAKHLIAAINVTTLEGHSGSRRFQDTMVMITEKGFSSVISIDLENLKVSGKMTELFNMTMHLSYGLFETFVANPRQLVALILHEIGHPFNFFLGLGDYVYVNYMLTDGVQILTGKKRTSQKVMVVDHTFLTKQIKDPKEQHEFMNSRDEEDVKKVVLSTLRAQPRPYLFYGTKNDTKRDEQLADVLPTRLGYAKDLVEALLTIDKLSPKLFQSKTSFWLMELMHLPMFAVSVLPVAAMLFVIGNVYEEKYDKPWHRIDRIRRDLIAQLKVTTVPEICTALVADMDALEVIANQYTRNEGLVDHLLYFINRDFRRGHQMDAHERTLESLLNNNMFVLSQKFSQLQK